MDPIDRISGQLNTLDDDLLILTPGRHRPVVRNGMEAVLFSIRREGDPDAPAGS